jgi:hypothetical protein
LVYSEVADYFSLIFAVSEKYEVYVYKKNKVYYNNFIKMPLAAKILTGVAVWRLKEIYT